jgi:hypothetical protein
MPYAPAPIGKPKDLLPITLRPVTNSWRVSASTVYARG